MTDPAIAKLAAAAPLAIGGVLVLLNPIYDRLIERGAEREFSTGNFLAEGATNTPVQLLTRYTSWALDLVQAGPLVIGPLIGLIAALNFRTLNGVIAWIYAAFVLVGFAIFACTAALKSPVLYGAKKYGWTHKNELLFGWTRVSIAAMILYFGAAGVAAYLA